ncbi:hypothetical protein SAMN05444008_112130 [Cnuella takakiae]|uniref:Uncharacterized protein n=1 Tax=Cnuella takakiae TaxID=1302690 RepID=A0A1M5EPX7_9BACT|nr:hypothetical protein SAMN05444008_112130 [Cnuella takakiae]
MKQLALRFFDCLRAGKLPKSPGMPNLYRVYRTGIRSHCRYSRKLLQSETSCS